MLSGVMVGGIYALVALGFVIIYKSSKVINFAQGQLVMFGAFILWVFLVTFAIPLPAALLLGLGCAVLMGFLIDRLTIRPLIGQPLLAIIAMTIGLAVFLDAISIPIFGGNDRGYPGYFPIGGMAIGNLSISYEYLWSFIVAMVLFGAFAWFFRYSMTGLAMRAVAEGHDTARAAGVKVRKAFTWSWIIACVSAMVGGFLLGNIECVTPGLSTIGLKAFPVVLLGGLESIPGCIVGGAIVGILEMLAAGYLDPLTGGGMTEVMPFVIMILVLLFKPYGLFGEVRIERI